MASPKPYVIWAGQPLRIGYSQGYNGVLGDVRYIDSLIDDVVLYNRALNESEVKQIMAGNIGIATAVNICGKATATWAGIKAQ